MEKTINEVKLLGRIGYLKHGLARNQREWFYLSLATHDYQGKDDDGKPKFKSNWHDVVFFGKSALNASKILQKGDKVHISGKLDITIEPNSDKSIKHYRIIGSDFIILANGKSDTKAPYGVDNDGPNTAEINKSISLILNMLECQ